MALTLIPENLAGASWLRDPAMIHDMHIGRPALATHFI